MEPSKSRQNVIISNSKSDILFLVLNNFRSSFWYVILYFQN